TRAANSVSSAWGWRDLAKEALYHTGSQRLLERIARSRVVLRRPGAIQLKLCSRPRLAILCYHRVGTGGVPLYSQLAPQIFESQMRYLRRHYRLISLDALTAQMENPSTTEPTVAVTFDDGYRDLFTHALPILSSYQIPATVFLTAGAIETGEVAWYDRIFLALQVAPGLSLDYQLDQPRQFSLVSNSERMRAAVEIITFMRRISPAERQALCAVLESKVQLPLEQLRGRMLTWDQVRAMASAGISFGAHTMTHPVVSRLTAAELDWELRESKRMIEDRLGRAVRHFAFPFGKHQECGDSALTLLPQLGYVSASTTEPGLNSSASNPFELKRISIDDSPSLAVFAFRLNQHFLLAGEESSSAAPHVAPSQASASQEPVVRPEVHRA
ncbi:MAG TPA: polysaccharide deacetylase family protein, partial [Candidatus Acidoferrales bacterium]|nr:polysaccharide deacetylase family protein [Candidatus Acidoferrales bacterium]